MCCMIHDSKYHQYAGTFVNEIYDTYRGYVLSVAGTFVCLRSMIHTDSKYCQYTGTCVDEIYNIYCSFI